MSADEAGAEFVRLLRQKIAADVTIRNIDDGDVIITFDEDAEFMIHVEYL